MSRLAAQLERDRLEAAYRRARAALIDAGLAWARWASMRARTGPLTGYPYAQAGKPLKPEELAVPVQLLLSLATTGASHLEATLIAGIERDRAAGAE